MWEKITVEQFQKIHQLTLVEDMDEMDKLTQAVCILHGKTEEQVEDMTQAEFIDICKKTAFVFNKDEIPGKPKRYLKAGGNRYFIQYKPDKLRFRQYAESCHFSKDLVPHLHFIMASIVQPTWFGLFPRRNKAKQHAKIANDLLGAKFIDVYHTAVFFCKLYTTYIENIRGYLENQLMKVGKTKEEANLLITASISAMDGFLPQSESQITKE
jgi:hypothetical protein